MAVEANKASMRRLYEIVQSGNLELLDEVVAVDILDHNPLPGVGQGLTGLKQTFKMLHDAFPKMDLTIDHLIAEDDLVAARFTMRAVHQGELMGIAATGKQVTITGMDIMRFKDGKGVEHWANQDDLGMMQQFGMMPAFGQMEREEGK